VHGHGIGRHGARLFSSSGFAATAATSAARMRAAAENFIVRGDARMREWWLQAGTYPQRATRAAGALKPEISPFTAHALMFGKAGGAVHRKLAQFDFINLGTHDRTPSPPSIMHCADSDVCLSSASAARPSAT
jgi:hypothetical protein